jgi:putative membrane protein
MFSALILSAGQSSAGVATAAAAHWVGPWAGGFFPFFFIIPIFWILVIGLIVFLVTRRRRAFWREHGPYGQFGPWQASSNAEATLAERFAQGDIDEVEYRKRLEVLRANRPGPMTR